MKKILLAVLLLFALVMPLAAQEDEVTAIEPRAPRYTCLKCGSLDTSTSLIDTEIGGYNEACIHGKQGSDHVTTYLRTYEVTCHNCGHVFEARTTSSSRTCYGY